LYAKAEVSNIDVEFLVDSGSTASLLSKHLFDRINNVQQIPLYQKGTKIQGVNGAVVKSYGYADIDILFGSREIKQTVIVCDIRPEGVLGQDFVLKHIKNWNFDSMSMLTRQSEEIRCHFGGKGNTSCRVTVREEVKHMTVVPEVVDTSKLGGVCCAAHIGCKSTNALDAHNEDPEPLADRYDHNDTHLKDEGKASLNDQLKMYPDGCSKVTRKLPTGKRVKQKRDIVKKNLKNLKNCNTKSKKWKYCADPAVWLHNPIRKVGVRSKTRNKWKRPYFVRRVQDDLICMVKRSRTRRRRNIKWTDCLRTVEYGFHTGL